MLERFVALIAPVLRARVPPLLPPLPSVRPASSGFTEEIRQLFSSALAYTRFYLEYAPFFISRSAPLLALVPLLLRLFPGSRPLERPWQNRVDIPIALLCGVVIAPLHAFLMAPYYFAGQGVTGTDFEQYCALVGYLRSGREPPWHYDRSLVSSMLPAAFARSVGVVDGLVLSGIVSAAVLAAALYLWGRALHGRTAGLTAALFSCSVGPIVILTRSLTFYSQWTAAFTLAAAGGALAVALRSRGAILFSGTAAGLALLIDVRGLIWALPPLGLTLLVVVQRSWRETLVRLGLLALPLTLSFGLAHRINAPDTTPLEVQVGHFMTDGLRNSGMAPGGIKLDERLRAPSRFLWGHSNPLEIPRTILSLLGLSEELPELAHTQRINRERNRHVVPWLEVGGACLVLATYLLRRDRLRLLALYVTVIPFGVALWKTATVFVQVRMLATATPALPLLVGLGFVTLLEAPLPWTRPVAPPVDEPERRAGLRRWARPVALAVVLPLVVMGHIPTWLSPVAAWRFYSHGDDSIFEMLHYLETDKPAPRDEIEQCRTFLKQDGAQGHPVTRGLFPLKPEP